MSLMRSKFTSFLIVAVVGVSALIGAAIAFGSNGNTPVASLSSGVAPGATERENIDNLAGSVTRWNQESPDAGPGNALASKATSLLTNVGRDKSDTLSAFPTGRGQVCFEIKAAGTCGSVDTPTGIIFAILSIRGRSTVLYGVAADNVTRVQVQIGGQLTDALLSGNGFYYQLPVDAAGGDVKQVLSTWADGSVHTDPIHP